VPLFFSPQTFTTVIRKGNALPKVLLTWMCAIGPVFIVLLVHVRREKPHLKKKKNHTP